MRHMSKTRFNRKILNLLLYKLSETDDCIDLFDLIKN